jgi:diguanylate cyclase (GGDEF)-like protein
MTTAHDVRRPYCETCRKPLVDGLTGVLDRHEWDRRAADAALAAQEREQPVALILADLDSFKSVNDTYGHLAGDAVLRAVAGVLADIDGGIAGRYGRHAGDEFLVLLPGATAAEAVLAARRAQDAVRQLAVPARASRRTTVTIAGQTVSMGIAALAPLDAAGAQPDVLADLLLDSDVGLRAAKRSGGDMVCGADAEQPPARPEHPREAPCPAGTGGPLARVPRARRSAPRPGTHDASDRGTDNGPQGAGASGEVRIPLASFGQEAGGGPEELVLSSAAAEHLHEVLGEVLGRRPSPPVSAP